MTFTALRADAYACFAAALGAVEPYAAVVRMLARDGDAIVLRARAGAELARHSGAVCVVGAGKAVTAMAAAARSIVGPSLSHGVVIAPHGSPTSELGPIATRHGAHPVPDLAGLEATAALLDLVATRAPDTLVLVLLSGGGSALLVAPSDGIALADQQTVTRELLAAGAEIGALNALRKHCSRVKGGGLARAAAGAGGCWTLVLSDVVGDDLATIASGPTVADPTTYGDALAALAHYRVTPPASIAAHLRRGAAGAVAETVKAGDPILARARAAIVGSNADAVAAAAAEATRRGYAVTVEPRPLEGDAAAAGERLASTLRSLTDRGPVALVAGGETTVRARPGAVGGRSQHLALAAAMRLEGMHGVLLAAGTDGIDGSTEAAGGCVDGETTMRARAAGVEPRPALDATDSHRCLRATGDLVLTGATGTNVADVVVALRAPA